MLIHILRKDAREHWIAIALAVAMIVISVLVYDSLEMHTAIVDLLSMGAWAALVARLVHSEAIPGDRQYWLTRPVPRLALLGAKVLGTVLFLHVPHFIADALALTRHGFNPLEHFGGLLWKQGLTLVVWTLPLLSVAAVTRTFAQYVLVLLSIVAVGALGDSLLLSQMDSYWMGVHWTKGLAERLAALGIGAAILWLQYFKRRTLMSRALTGAGLGVICLIAVMSPWSVAYAIQQFVNPARIDGSSLQPVFDPGRSVPLDALGFQRNKREVNIMLPVTWRGLPEGVEIMPDRTEATIRLSNGEVLRPAARSALNWTWHPGWSWASFALHEDLLERAGTQHVDLDLRLFVTVYGRARTYRMPVATGRQLVPDVGQCLTGRETYGFTLRCRAPLQNKALIMTRLHDVLPGDQLTWTRLSFELSYSPFPTELWMGKPFRTAMRTMQRVPMDGKAEVEFLVREPVGHLEVGMVVKGVKLSEYAVRR